MKGAKFVHSENFIVFMFVPSQGWTLYYLVLSKKSTFYDWIDPVFNHDRILIVPTQVKGETLEKGMLLHTALILTFFDIAPVFSPY